nr:RibD C-terminal domain protein [uncultured bacterium]
MTKNRTDLLLYYNSLSFRKQKNRPHFYTSFVSTLDGKIFVKKPGYWPIGSATDYEVFTLLRAHADIIIDGKNTACAFGKHTIETIHSPSFRKLRKKLKKSEQVEYGVISSHPDEALVRAMQNTYDFKPLLLTSDNVDALVYHNYFKAERIFSETEDRLTSLVSFLHKSGYENVFIDGGPTLLASFVEKKILDAVFLTLAPKIFGSEGGTTLTLVEGKLFDPKETAHYTLIHSAVEGDEVFLHYT